MKSEINLSLVFFFMAVASALSSMIAVSRFYRNDPEGAAICIMFAVIVGLCSIAVMIEVAVREVVRKLTPKPETSEDKPDKN